MPSPARPLIISLRVCRSVEPLCALALARAQDDAISINDLSSVARPTDPRSPSTAFLPAPTVSLSEGLTCIPAPTTYTSPRSPSKSNNKVKIADGVVAALAAPRAPPRRLLHLPHDAEHSSGAAPNTPAKFALAGLSKHHTGTGMGQVYADQPPHQTAIVVHDYWQDIKAPASELA
ncbi:hypothetical protein B0H13DRAFT_2366846 [Mycena leptocephala]|nr:hypothetical protein B0H13DRAFT_2366846 [Mycena leptocephala]